MLPQPHFRLTRQAVLLGMIAAAFPVTGYCVAAGHADFVSGDVVAIATDGSRRPLVKGSEIDSGDSINTVSNARVQIRFTDGGYVSLQPNTSFRVAQYNFQGKTDGEEKGFFSLLKGGLRAITGLIGHRHRDNYKVTTAVATIGIRGTGYNVVLGDGLSVSVADGSISLTNNGGTLILTQGQSAFVADMNTAPTLTFEKPATPPASLSGTGTPPPPEDYVAGDCVGTCGGGVSAGTTVLTGVAAAHSGTAFGTAAVGLDYPGIVVLDLVGNQTFYLQGQNPAGALTDFTAATLDKGVYNGIPAAGFDGTVGWGRFYGPVSYTEPGFAETTVFNANQGIHSVVGIPTAAMPTSGNAHYALTGATAPTLVSGAVAPGAVSGGGLDVFFSASPSVYGTLNLAIGGYNYALQFSGTVSGNGTSGSSLYSYAGSTNGGCVSCSASVAGFFAGANAERAGVAYGIGSNALGSTIQGAAVYSRTASPALAY